MASVVNIKIEPAKMLTMAAELDLTKAAVHRNPDSLQVRLRLAQLLNKLDMFSASIDTLARYNADHPSLMAMRTLITAHFARNNSDDDLSAQRLAERALPFANTDIERSYLFAELSKALLRMGQPQSAIPLLWQALELDPSNANAFKRLVYELLHQQQPQQVVALTDKLKQMGVSHSRLLASRAMALAAAGHPDAAQQLLGAGQFLHAEHIQAPSGWANLSAFNAAVANEVSSNPDLRFERYGTSSQKARRVDHPATGATPAVSALLVEIARIATAHAASFSASDHWWASVRPLAATLRSWCVITEGNGYEKWHMHPEGWMSGGYYVEVPDGVAYGGDEAGCLAFGIPDGLIGEEAAHSVQLVQIRPTPGLLTLFPSHAYHRTFPHNKEGRRMCIAFDIRPT